MRNKALQDPNFPDENLINEYLVKKDNVSQLNLKWKQPDLVRFVVSIDLIATSCRARLGDRSNHLVGQLLGD